MIFGLKPLALCIFLEIGLIGLTIYYKSGLGIFFCILGLMVILNKARGEANKKSSAIDKW